MRIGIEQVRRGRVSHRKTEPYLRISAKPTAAETPAQLCVVMFLEPRVRSEARGCWHALFRRGRNLCQRSGSTVEVGALGITLEPRASSVYDGQGAQEKVEMWTADRVPSAAWVQVQVQVPAPKTILRSMTEERLQQGEAVCQVCAMLFGPANPPSSDSLVWQHVSRTCTRLS